MRRVVVVVVIVEVVVVSAACRGCCSVGYVVVCCGGASYCVWNGWQWLALSLSVPAIVEDGGGVWVVFCSFPKLLRYHVGYLVRGRVWVMS